MKNLIEERQKAFNLVKQAREIAERAELEERELTGEEVAESQRVLDEVDKINTNITIEERMQIYEMEHAPSQPPANDPDAQKEEKRAAFFKYIREGEQALNREEQRAVIENTSGLYLVPQDMLSTIYNNLPLICPIRKYATVVQTNVDKVLKRSLGDITIGWGKLETGTEITESTPTPGQDTIYVEDLAGLVKVGKDLLRDLSDQSLEALLTQRFVEAMAKAEASAFLIGRGHTTYGEPEGVTLDATIKSSTQTDLDTADTVVPDDLLDIEYGLPSPYHDGSIFTMHPTAALQVRKVKATYGPYLWQPSLLAGQPNGFDGFPVILSSDMIAPASGNTSGDIVAVFGNWKRGYVILDRQQLEIQRLEELYAEAGLVGFIGHFRVGGGVVLPDAFRALDNNT